MDATEQKIMEDIELIRQFARKDEYDRNDEIRLKGFAKVWDGYKLLIRREQNRIFAERNQIVMERFQAMYPKYFGKKDATLIE
jgi:hypothetical protein